MESLWQRFQERLYFHPGLQLHLDVSRMRFDDGVPERLDSSFAAAFAAMEALEKGSIANPDEQRMVGHYWLRHPDLAPSQEIRTEIVEGIERIECFARDVHQGTIHPPTAPRFTDLLSIGIGGSALGPQFVAAALAPDQPPLAIHFIDNTDPAGIDRVLAGLRDRLGTTLVIDTSKSGGTPEPRNGLLEVQQAFAAQGLDFARHAVAITMPGSRIDRLAHAQHWLAEFPMYDWVGGRTSVLSAVGLVPAALQGIDFRALLEGARVMDEATRVPLVRSNPAALLALSWFHAGDGRGTKDMVVLPPRVQERCHPSHPYTRGLEDMTNAPIQRGRQG